MVTSLLSKVWENDEKWRDLFANHESETSGQLNGLRSKHMRYPADKRCVLCSIPFDGAGFEAFGRRMPNVRNPHYCDACDEYMSNLYPGKVKHACPIIAIDMRGSTLKAKQADQRGLDYLLSWQQPFESATFEVLAENDGFLENWRGDELKGIYPRGFSGESNAKKAWNTALALLQRSPRAGDGSEISLGIGVHFGDVWIYSRGTPEKEEPYSGCGIAGYSINVTSRFCDQANKQCDQNEALISEILFEQAGLSTKGLERRSITVKDTGDKFDVFAVHADSDVSAFEFEDDISG